MANLRPLVITSSGTPRVIQSPDLVDPGALGSGTPNSANFLRGDGSWITVPNAGTPVQGFQSSNLSHYYQSSTSGVTPGANDFVAIVTGIPFDARNGAKIQFLASCVTAGTGWVIGWIYGQLGASVYFNAGANALNPAASTSLWSLNQKRGELHAVGLRVYGAGTGLNPTAELWIGPVVYDVQVAGFTGPISPCTTVPCRLGSGVLFGDEFQLNGAVSSFGYYEGAVTTDQMRFLMGSALAQSRIDTDSLAWDLVVQGSSTVSIPSSFTSDVGGETFNEIGSPTSLTGYFPPGGSGGAILVGSVGGNVDGGSPFDNTSAFAIDGGSP